MARRDARLRTVRAPLLRLLLATAVLVLAVVPGRASADAGTTATSRARTVVVTTTADPGVLDRLPGVEVHPGGDDPRGPALTAEVTATGAAALEARPDVLAVEADVPVSIDAGDPLHAANWAAEVLDLEAAWARTEGARVVVAVLDTGVAPHPELAGRLWTGWDALTGTVDGRGDPHGHGTMSALTVAAARGDGLGSVGVCPRCVVLPVRVLAADGRGSLASITNGIHAAIDLGADVISISASGGTGTTSPRYLSDAVARAAAAGIPVVASAGNAGSDAGALPAGDAGVIGVAGSARDDSRYTWSNHGPWVDVAAPGCYRVSDPHTPTDGRWYCGTSAAAPVVSGALALARAAGRPADVASLRTALTSTSVPLPYVASGRLDVCPLMTGGFQRPTVVVHAPTPGATVQDGTRLTFSASDDCGLTQVRVRAGGATVGSLPLSGTAVSRLGIPLDLGDVPLGSTTLQVTATDRHGRTRTLDVPVTHGRAATSSPTPSAPVSPFDDVSGPHAPAVAQLAETGVTAGCAPRRYCPADTVTRAQMATFLVRALDPPRRDAPPRFHDVTGGPHAPSITQLAASGITAGCGPGRYCPADTVTRAQMASFLDRALGLEVTTSGTAPRFGDVRGGPHADAIGRLAASGITTGCSPGRYCPDETVTRAQMATFLIRAIDGRTR